MDKRPLPLSPNAVQKRGRPLVPPRDADLVPKSRPRKTTYFFQTTNTLTGSGPERAQNGPTPSKTTLRQAPTDIKTFSSSPGPKSPGKTPYSADQQSSDDTFDGIRWRTSPRNAQNKPQVPVLLSPLKNASFADDNGASFVNEQANSVFTKYGASLCNISSQTPQLARANSEGVSETSGGDFLPASPTLVRAKSFGNAPQPQKRTPIPYASQKNPASRLTTWIDKFETGSTPSRGLPKESENVHETPIGRSENHDNDSDISSNTSEHSIKCTEHSNDQHHESVHTPEILPQPPSMPPSILPSTKKSIEDVLQEMDFSDFSDSEIQPHPSSRDGPEVQVTNILSTELGLQVAAPVSDQNNSDDPFSDDELLLEAVKSQHIKSVTPGDEMSSMRVSESMAFPKTDVEVTDSDPFSDDDMEVLAATQPRPNLLDLQITLNGDGSKLKGAVKPDRILKEDNDRDKYGARLSYSRPDFNRYQIQLILKNSYKIAEREKDQLIMTVQDGNCVESKLVVRGEYALLDYMPNDIVHIILTTPETPKLIDDTHNLLIWNPDILVSSTTVAEQLECLRKTVLLSRFNFPGESSIPLVVGNIVHEAFQACFKSEMWSASYITDVIDQQIDKNLLNIFSMGDVVSKVRLEAYNHIQHLEEWFSGFYKQKPKAIPTNKYQQSILFAANEALDIEESIWSPMFGLKGKIDVTLDAQLQNKASGGRYVLPMEIKTGKEYISHQVQTSLYSLLFKDRYDMDVLAFLLVYSKEGITKKYDISPHELKLLVNLRNRLTKYLKGGTRELPDLVRRSKCDRCDIQQACMTLNKLLEDGDAQNSGIDPQIYEEMTAHLSNVKHREFYDFWDDLITKEEDVLSRFKKELWVLPSKEREENGGKAISDLVIESSNDSDESLSEFRYSFRKADGELVNLQDSQITLSDRVVVSDESGHFAIAQGRVVDISLTSITISVRRRIISTSLKTTSFNANNQSFQGVLRKSQQRASFGEQVRFRLDLDDMFYGMGLARFNLLNLFMSSGDKIRRELIVDLGEPRFSKKALPFSKETFNEDQIRAFDKVLRTEDYSLILGMPGTGKTTVIASLIKSLVKSKKTVLLASYTHSAVDNILLKVKDYNIKFLRVGMPSKVHRDIRPYIPGYGEQQIDTHAEFSKQYLEPPVVAATCLGINDIVFSLRTKFDYCIIDEASQVSMPVCLGPLRFCERFVLVGDHHQLPPLVVHPNSEVRKGLSRSLFKLLSEAHPLSVVELTYQYRMSEDIMSLSNELIYNSHLKCGSEQVAAQTMNIPDPKRIERYITIVSPSQRQRWLDTVLEPSNNVIFFDHDPMPALEKRVSNKIENAMEVELVRQIVEGLNVCGVSESRIGVMSLYRSQLKLLVNTFRSKPDIEVLTADQYQGRDKDCIIISLVRSNTDGIVGDLLKEWRRFNVAITRAKTKLVILGSRSTLCHAPNLKQFIDLLASKNWIHDLPAEADKVYSFPRDKTGTIRPHSGLKADSKLVKSNHIIRDIINEITN